MRAIAGGAWDAAGIVDDWWGRAKVLGATAFGLGGVLALVWFFALDRVGVLGVVVIAVAVACIGLGGGTLLVTWRKGHVREQPAVFPGGRIQVKDIGYFDDDDGRRTLLFAVQVTNREVTRRMNLQVEFVLKMFQSVARHNPGLRGIDTNLHIVAKGKNPPPDPLVVDAQDSPPEFVYATEWHLNSGLTFDEEMWGFSPERDDDELVMRVCDLQTGGRIEIPIPGVWES